MMYRGAIPVPGLTCSGCPFLTSSPLPLPRPQACSPHSTHPASRTVLAPHTHQPLSPHPPTWISMCRGSSMNFSMSMRESPKEEAAS